jgi:hypothetical protein
MDNFIVNLFFLRKIYTKKIDKVKVLRLKYKNQFDKGSSKFKNLFSKQQNMEL